MMLVMYRFHAYIAFNILKPRRGVCMLPVYPGIAQVRSLHVPSVGKFALYSGYTVLCC